MIYLMKAMIQINEAELAHIREYLTGQRRGSAYSLDAGETVREICRRVGFDAVADEPRNKRKVGQCYVCGCTMTDPCDPGRHACSWADDQGETICSRCADA